MIGACHQQLQVFPRLAQAPELERRSAVEPYWETDVTTTSGLEFEDVDGSRDPGALLAYLDVTTAEQSVQG